MNTKVGIMIAGGVLILGTLFYFVFLSPIPSTVKKPQDAMMDKPSAEQVMNKDSIKPDGETMKQQEGQKVQAGMPGKADMQQASSTASDSLQSMHQNSQGVYTEYTPTALTSALGSGKKVVLFFWAAWCPFCKTANADFEANTSLLPENTVVFKVNYDTEKALKQKYGVTYQHTFVQVDISGKQMSKWSGGGTTELKTNIK